MQFSDGYEAIVIGVSAGGLRALSEILPQLPADFALPVLVVQHRSADVDDYLARHLNDLCQIPVREVTDKEPVEAGVVHVAPGGYHLLVEQGRTLSLSLDAPVNHSRPSIDVLFESAADVYGPTLVGVVLTGASSDGARGLERIREGGGLTIVQDPSTAESPFMPTAARDLVVPDQLLSLQEIGPYLRGLVRMAECGAGDEGRRAAR